jgi:hypothetical protein
MTDKWRSPSEMLVFKGINVLNVVLLKLAREHLDYFFRCNRNIIKRPFYDCSRNQGLFRSRI